MHAFLGTLSAIIILLSSERNILTFFGTVVDEEFCVEALAHHAAVNVSETDHNRLYSILYFQHNIRDEEEIISHFKAVLCLSSN